MAENSLIDLSSQDISKLKVPDLKKELKNRGYSTSGNKNDLVERLQSALKSSDSVIDDIEEDLLNDDDDEHLDESESVINELDHDLEDSPNSQKRKLDSSDKSDISIEPPKKVVLNRNNSINIGMFVQQPKDADKKDTDPIKDVKKSNLEKDDKKVIKISELSVKERLEMRAKKFGVLNLSDEAKKLARAERFGTNKTISGSIGSTIKLSNSADLDTLKKRAERFGGSVSTIMSDMEKQEKLEKRKERFGVTASSNGISNNEEAKAARLERFKQPVK